MSLQAHQQRSRNHISAANTAPHGGKKQPRPDPAREAYANDGSVAEQLAVKILMKKRQEQGRGRDLSEEELRREVLAQMKSGVYQKMDRMIENLKRYREDFRGTRVPTFLMSKQQLHEHRQMQKNLKEACSAGETSQAEQHRRSTSRGNHEEKHPDAS